MSRDLSRYNPSLAQIEAQNREIDACLARRLAKNPAEARRFFAKSKLPKAYLDRIRKQALAIWRSEYSEEADDER